MTEIQQKLLAHAEANSLYDSEWILASVDNPKWEDASRVHEWRGYVDGDLREIWLDLSLETRLAIYAFASYLAGREEWE